MIAECIPSQATHLSMVLLSVFSSMGENQIQLKTLLQGLEQPTLDLLALLGKKPSGSSLSRTRTLAASDRTAEALASPSRSPTALRTHQARPGERHFQAGSEASLLRQSRYHPNALPKQSTEKRSPGVTSRRPFMALLRPAHCRRAAAAFAPVRSSPRALACLSAYPSHAESLHA